MNSVPFCSSAQTPARTAGPSEYPLLPRAALYDQLLRESGWLVCERSTPYPPVFSERHLQCIWYNPELRPKQLKTIHGEPVSVQHPGTWNLEPGPDFLNALLLVNGERVLSGDVEIHLRPDGWKQHGHHENRQYDGVCAHVTYHPPQHEPDSFPPGTIHIALKDALDHMPAFDFDNIDLTAYPYNIPGENTPCRMVLKSWKREDVEALLTSAGEARLRQKADRCTHELQHTETAEILYRETLGALGYKNNKIPFRLLAERVPLKRLRASAQDNVLTAYALLAGVSGLLPHEPHRSWSSETRAFLRTLWDIWWRQDDAWHQQTLPKDLWRLSGIRPGNHPLRRLMAAATLFTGLNNLPALMERISAEHHPFSTTPFLELLQKPSNTWWDHHLSWSGKATPEPVKLIGPDRAGAICSNVIIPLYIAIHREREDNTRLLKSLPRESDNAVVRQTAFMLLGRDAPRALYASPICRQGLIRIFHDFCLNDRTRCTQCPLPALLKQLETDRSGPHAV